MWSTSRLTPLYQQFDEAVQLQSFRKRSYLVVYQTLTSLGENQARAYRRAFGHRNAQGNAMSSHFPEFFVPVTLMRRSSETAKPPEPPLDPCEQFCNRGLQQGADQEQTIGARCCRSLPS